MVKPFAHDINGPWLQSPSSSKIQDASYRFNSEADPLYQKAIAANHKTEAERRTEQAGESGESSGTQQQHKRNLSKPLPVQKPRSQRGRSNDNPEPWLAKQYEAAVRNAKARPDQTTIQHNVPHQDRGQTPSM